MPNYILKRRAGYYVRARIPADLVAAFGATHLTRSLGTRDHATALRRAINAAAMLGDAWDEVRLKMGGEYRHWTEEVDEQWEQQQALNTAAEIEETAAPDIKTYTAEEIAGVIKAVRADERSAKDSKPDASQEELAHAKGVIEGMERAMARMPTVAAPASAEPTPNPRHRKMWHAEVVPEFFEKKGFGESTRVSNERAFRECCELIGDKPIGDLTADDLRRYRDWLVAKPGKKPGTTYAHQSIVKDLGHVKSFLAWAVGEDWLAINPAEKVRTPEAKSAAAKRDLGIADEDAMPRWRCCPPMR